jgi:hypothetical protein
MQAKRPKAPELRGRATAYVTFHDLRTIYRSSFGLLTLIGYTAAESLTFIQAIESTNSKTD